MADTTRFRVKDVAMMLLILAAIGYFSTLTVFGVFFTFAEGSCPSGSLQ